MIREIVKDRFMLSRQSKEATREDLYIIDDLIDTMKSREEFCVGMAANMINELKRIIVVMDNEEFFVMINPVLLETGKQSYEIEEACLCHQGTKKVKRYKKIKVQYCDKDFKIKIKTFYDFTAQIIQHEMDHCNGILI